jgi:hypothetical protein
VSGELVTIGGHNSSFKTNCHLLVQKHDGTQSWEVDASDAENSYININGELNTKYLVTMQGQFTSGLETNPYLWI